MYVDYVAAIDGSKQILRRGVLMGRLQQSGQMLPLWVGKPGEESVLKSPPFVCYMYILATH